MIAKCGTIVRWHWAHESIDCDPWHEGESLWHLWWKKRFPDEWQEVVVGNHRADVKTPVCVIELQASHLSVEEIRAREEHYGKMVWLLDGTEFVQNISFRERGEYTSFRWKWPRKSWWHARRPIIIDVGLGLFRIKKLYGNTPCGGWGYWLDDQEFIEKSSSVPERRRAIGNANT